MSVLMINEDMESGKNEELATHLQGPAMAAQSYRKERPHGAARKANREPIVSIRLARNLIRRVDLWAAHHNSPSRSEAIRHILEEGLKTRGF